MRMVFFSLVMVCVTVVCGATPFERFDDARRRWDAQGMESARQELHEEVLARHGDADALYRLAVCEFHLLLCYALEDSSGYNPPRAAEMLEEVQETIQQALGVRAEDGELLAMQASVRGLRIQQQPWTAAWLGPRVLALQRRARRLDPDNPRVLYLIGAGWLRAPALFRSPERAGGYLEQARQRFEEEAVGGRTGSDWGWAETYGLLGDYYRETGQQGTARKMYLRALEINPDYTPAKVELNKLEEAT